jgi:hypothetical protein
VACRVVCAVPVARPVNWTEKPFQLLDRQKAGTQTLLCSDPRCRGECEPGILRSKDTCGPHGGTCTLLEGGVNACSFGWLYGDGSMATGVLLDGPMTLGGAVRFNATFGGIVNATDNFFEAPDGGGIMGLSFGNYSLCSKASSCFNPVLDSIVAQLNYADKFSICASRGNSTLILGGGDDKLYTGPLQKVALQPPFDYYHVTIKSVTVDGKPLGDRRHLRANGTAGAGGPSSVLTAIVDTGNPFLSLPEYMYYAFCKQIRESLKSVPQLVDGPESLFQGYARVIPPELLTQMPVLKLELDNGVVLTLTSQEYTQTLKVQDAGTELRGLGIIPAGRRVAIGQTVLHNRYVEYDRSSRTISIADAVPGCRKA